MEKLVVFNDYANLSAAFRQQGGEPDYQDLLRYLSEGRFLVEAHAFVPIDPRNPHARDQAIEDLWHQGYLVHSKLGALAGDTYRCDFDVELTLELMRTAEMVKPDIVVLISGDKDFIPVIIELRRRGIRVEVAAFPNVNAAREVVLKGSGFIDLQKYMQERDERQFAQHLFDRCREPYADKQEPIAALQTQDQTYKECDPVSWEEDDEP